MAFQPQIPFQTKEKKEGALYINALQKREKKTNFSADPNFVSRHGGILGWGRRPLFVYFFKYGFAEK